MYLTFDEYIDFGGKITDETTFNDLEFQAETMIDWYTFARLQKDTTVDVRVKKCVMMLIKLINDKMIASALPSDTGQTTGVQASIASQSNDGVSISYNILSASEIVANSQEEIAHCIQMSLQGVRNEAGRKITWRGVYPDE